MWPGVLFPKEGYGDFKSYDLRCVFVYGNPCPCAVGRLTLNSDQVDENTKGKALKIEHIFNDALWKYSKQVIPVGFTSTKIKPIMKMNRVEVEEESGEDEEEQNHGQVDEKEEELVQLEEQEEEQGNNTEEKMKEMDQVILKCFVQVLKSVNDEDLPMDMGLIYSKMIQIKPPTIEHLDIKKSNHKKVSFLSILMVSTLVA
jgi:hypothetical protein